MRIDHLFLGFNNDTALNGMKFLIKQSISRGYVSKILILKNQSNKVRDLDKKNIIYVDLFKIKLLTILNLFNCEILFLIINYFFKKSSISRNYKTNLLIELKKFLWKKKFKATSFFVNSILIKYNPRTIYCYSDRIRTLEVTFLKIAKLLRIRTVIPPIATFNNNENLLENIRPNINNYKRKDVTDLNVFRRSFKNQIIYDKFTKKYISFYEPWLVEVMNEEDILSQNPWQLGLSTVSYVCLPGEIDYKKFKNNNVPKNKLIITGFAEHDTLYKKFINYSKTKKDFCKYNDISPKDKIILISLPNGKEHKIWDEKTHWEIINEICSKISKIKSNIFLSLHPKCNREEYLFLEKKYSLKILNEPLREILPVADIYISNANSSTAIWSILCEIPLIIIDLFNNNFPMNTDNINGIVCIKDLNNLNKVAKKIIFNSNECKRIKDLFKIQKNKLSIFDGNSTERILKVKTFSD